MTILKICPSCRRISVEYDYIRQEYRCLRRDCCWTSVDGREARDSYDDDFLPPLIDLKQKPLEGAIILSTAG